MEFNFFETTHCLLSLGRFLFLPFFKIFSVSSSTQGWVGTGTDPQGGILWAFPPFLHLPGLSFLSLSQERNIWFQEEPWEVSQAHCSLLFPAFLQLFQQLLLFNHKLCTSSPKNLEFLSTQPPSHFQSSGIEECCEI